MTIDDVRERLQRIQEAAGDNEAAHGYEDDLYVDVLQAICDGAENPAALARQALMARDIDYIRWYA